jgi:hypothetical protein
MRFPPSPFDRRSMGLRLHRSLVSNRLNSKQTAGRTAASGIIMQNHPPPAPTRAHQNVVTTKIIRPATPNDRPMGFSRRELRRLVADMIG